MKIKADPQDEYDVGVIVGRFQVPELHAVHKDLIQYVCDNHKRVIIFLGISPLLVTRNNPLDFEARRQMVQAEFPNVSVDYVMDVWSDDLWSQKLDSKINLITSLQQSVVLYGARDSFLKHYKGKLPTRELESDIQISGTDVRKLVSKDVKASPDFRAGVIWAAHNQFPTAYQCVDIVPFTTSYDEFFLGRKPTETGYRAFGGFADPNLSDSLWADAKRELHEESNLYGENLDIIDLFRIEDWRYSNEEDCINTVLFACTVMIPNAQPGDDIQEVRKFHVDEWKEGNWPVKVARNHEAMIESVLQYAHQKRGDN